MKKARMNISHSRFILFKLKIFGEIVTTFFLSLKPSVIQYQRLIAKESNTLHQYKLLKSLSLLVNQFKLVRSDFLEFIAI